MLKVIVNMQEEKGRQSFRFQKSIVANLDRKCGDPRRDGIWLNVFRPYRREITFNY